MRELLFHNKNFRHYLTGTTVSIAGSSLTDSIWPILTYWVTNSPFITSLTILTQVLPHLIFGLLAGAQVDRAHSKRAFLIYPNLLSGAAFFIAALIGADSHTAILIALSCYFLSECASIYYSAAIPAVLPRIVEKHSLATARSTVSVIVSVLTFALPGLAVYILSKTGPRPLFFADGLSFIIAAYLLTKISTTVLSRPQTTTTTPTTETTTTPTTQTTPETTTKPLITPLLKEIGEGFHYLWHHHDVRLLTLAGILNAWCGGVVLTMYVVLLSQHHGFHTNDSRLVFFVYCLTIGGTLGSAIFPKLKKHFHAIPIATTALIINAATVLIFALAPTYLLSLIAITIYQLTYSLIIMNAIVLRMEVVDEEYLGRVSASGRFISWGTSPIGAMIGGALITAGYPATTVIAGCAALPLLAAIYLITQKR